jgi:hypothetical protein
VFRSDQEKMMPEEARSLERITVRDLTQLARIAAEPEDRRGEIIWPGSSALS